MNIVRDSVDDYLLDRFLEPRIPSNPEWTVSFKLLQAIIPAINMAKALMLLPYLNDAVAEFEINSKARLAAFLAQIAHETDGLERFEEIWYPTDKQLQYENGKMAELLGNEKKGDGKRYRGRGAIPLTGRANYREYGKHLNIPLETHPEKAANPEYAFRIAGLFWKSNRCNPLADSGQFQGICKLINDNNYNDLTDRLAFYQRARVALAIGSD